MTTLQTKKQKRSFEGEARRRRDITERKANLPADRQCLTPGCKKKVSKESVGAFCPACHYRQRRLGHAFHRPPMGLQRQVARAVVHRFLEKQEGQQGNTFSLYLPRALDRLREAPTNALPPLRARSDARLLTTHGRAQIVLAWLGKRKDAEKVLTRLLLEAMTFQLWGAVFYADTKRRLPRLLHTSLGRMATRLAGIKETKTSLVRRKVRQSTYWAGEGPWKSIEIEETTIERWKPNHPTKTEVGKRIMQALCVVVSPGWITDELVAEALSCLNQLEKMKHV